MHQRTSHRFWVLGLTMAAVGALCPRAAEWGSIRGNNRDHEERGRAEEHRVERPEQRPQVVSRGVRPEVRHEEGRVPEREVRVPERARVPEREFRHFDTDIDRGRGYYWWGYHPGMVSRALPQGYVTFSVGNQPYYYYEGVYYEPGPSGYVVVTPPVGAVVSVLPPGVETLVANGTVYYYAGGAFYIQQPTGYAVVPPPLGVTVTTLPPGAVPVNINGNLYYTANSVYYMPVMQGGMTVYMTVRP